MSTTFQRVTKQLKRNVGTGSKTKTTEIRENKNTMRELSKNLS